MTDRCRRVHATPVLVLFGVDNDAITNAVIVNQRVVDLEIGAVQLCLHTTYTMAEPSYAEVVKDGNAVEHYKEGGDLHCLSIVLNVLTSCAEREEKKQNMEKSPEPSVLQRHILFWDRDGDGVIWPLHTFIGTRDQQARLIPSSSFHRFLQTRIWSNPFPFLDLRHPLFLLVSHANQLDS